MKVNKYYGTWSTNNGNTFNPEPLLSNNKAALKQDLISIIDGNLTGCFDIGSWAIWDIDNNAISKGKRKW